jgi:hypothetical protein
MQVNGDLKQGLGVLYIDDATNGWRNLWQACWYAVMGIAVAETIRPQAQIAGEKISSNGWHVPQMGNGAHYTF